MNKQAIDTARDADLRLLPQAMQRAARRARELAAQTGTAIVISRHGIIEHIRPERQGLLSQVQDDQAAPYSDK